MSLLASLRQGQTDFVSLHPSFVLFQQLIQLVLDYVEPRGKLRRVGLLLLLEKEARVTLLCAAPPSQ
jgi:hypothetical protein